MLRRDNMPDYSYHQRATCMLAIPAKAGSNPCGPRTATISTQFPTDQLLAACPVTFAPGKLRCPGSRCPRRGDRRDGLSSSSSDFPTTSALIAGSMCIGAGPRQACDQSGPQRIGNCSEDDRDSFGRMLRRERCLRHRRDNDVDFKPTTPPRAPSRFPSAETVSIMMFFPSTLQPCTATPHRPASPLRATDTRCAGTFPHRCVPAAAAKRLPSPNSNFNEMRVTALIARPPKAQARHRICLDQQHRRGLCPLWVKSRHLQCKTSCPPLYPHIKAGAPLGVSPPRSIPASHTVDCRQPLQSSAARVSMVNEAPKFVTVPVS